MSSKVKKEAFLAGYSDRLSGRPGDKIQFHVSSHATADFSTRLVRSICSDPNPDGPGIIEEDASTYFPPTSFPSRRQIFHPGSYACSESSISLSSESAVNEVRISVWCYLHKVTSNHVQTLASWGDISLAIDCDGKWGIQYPSNVDGADDDPDRHSLRCEKAASARRWYCCSLVLQNNTITIEVLENKTQLIETAGTKCDNSTLDMVLSTDSPFYLAKGGMFSGKLEDPEIKVNGSVLAGWDMSKNMASFDVPPSDSSQPCGILKLFNAPTRAVKGRDWDGSEFCWKHKPDHYGAVRFHDDDIYDFCWEVDFEFTIPEGMPSAMYTMRLEVEGHEEAIPFYVISPRGRSESDICVLIPTFTYVIYGNHARYDFEASWVDRIREWKSYPNNPSEYQEYGLSTYNFHSDGVTGISHASHRRPLFNMRPGYSTFGSSKCSGLRHLPADSHLLAWLEKKGFDYDIITDHDLDEGGIAELKNYKVLMTGSHPEYHTKETLEALESFRDQGGKLLYLGGNGFYWRIVRHKEDPSLLEIRRAEGGVRVWESEPGEYYSAFDGSYGGMWRRNGRPPQQLVGVGFSAQGAFTGLPYRRVNFSKDFYWIFDGIDQTILGNFGFSGGGAAGFELDRVDPLLDGGLEISILAQSTDRNEHFMLVPEGVLTKVTNTAGVEESEAKRADMVYFKTRTGGEVFAVGSITFCGSLPWNNFENNISRLLENVMRQFLSAREGK